MGFHESFWQGNGFAELKKCMKTSEEFCKDVSSLMAERAELEQTYQKALQKLAIKALKFSPKTMGTLQSAWSDVVLSMNAEVDGHRCRSLAEVLSNQISKPVKAHCDEMYKERKAGEAIVERAVKALSERRTKENSSRAASINRAKEVEVLMEALETEPKSEKETIKLGKSLKKAEELAAKCEKDYRRDCIEGENLRIDWEHAMYHFCQQMETVDQGKTAFWQDILSRYQAAVTETMPCLQEALDGLSRGCAAIDPVLDVTACCEIRGTGENTAEHVLYSCFAEDDSTAMNADRRIQALNDRCSYFFKESRKSEQFRQGLASSAGISTAENDLEQMAKINASIDYSQASLYKLRVALAESEGSAKPQYHLSENIEFRQSKGQAGVSIMRVPLTQGICRDNSPDMEDLLFTSASLASPGDVTSVGSGTDQFGKSRRFTFARKKNRSSLAIDDTTSAAGSARNSLRSSIDTTIGSRSHSLSMSASNDDLDDGGDDGDDDQDEFDDGFGGGGHGDRDDAIVCQCRAIYDYDGVEEMELTIHEGDIIDVTAKDGIGEGWWEGKLDGRQGVFPASYVEDM